jgi:hypothetical protein
MSALYWVLTLDAIESALVEFVMKWLIDAMPNMDKVLDNLCREFSKSKETDRLVHRNGGQGVRQ